MLQNDKFSKWYSSKEFQIQSDFFTLLAFPSVSAEKKHLPDIKKTAEWLKSFLQKAGLQSELWNTSGNPVVFAEKISKHPNAKTLLFYGHYDVQPVDPLELWQTPPFDPTLRNGAVYARGALDNKGQLFYTLSAIKAFIELYPDAPLSIKVFIEGEEESGGEGTYEALKKYKNRLLADELYVVDFDIKGANEPSITLGSRGILAMEMEITNAKIDLHSGSHGGIALNPLKIAVDLLSGFWDRKGKIAIANFYQGIKAIPPKDKKAIDWSFKEKSYSKEFGIKAFMKEQGFSLQESNWIRPCLEIHGIPGGYTGEGCKTVIPKTIKIKLSSRLVLGQDPAKVAKAIEKHCKKMLPKGVSFRFTKLHEAKAFFSSSQNTCVQTAKRAMEGVFNKKCALILCGASVPIVPDLQKASNAEVCLLGMGLGSDSIHAPNEHFALERFAKGFLVIAQILQISAGKRL